MISDKVLNFIEKTNLINTGEKIGIAVSGGIDSMCLLKFFIEAGNKLDIEICVLHLEHGIRGQDSIEDLNFVKSFCAKHKLDFISKSVDAVSESKRHKKSIETIARNLRYDFFEKCSKEYNLDKVALAHHADDRAETFIFNAVRGSGTKGLCSINAFRKPNYIRPFLCLYKKDILEFANTYDIPYREDITNNDLTYTRNKIRHNILNDLTDINANAAYNINRTADILYDENLYLEKITDKYYKQSVYIEDGQIVIDISKIKNTDIVIKRRLIRKAIQKKFDLIDVEFSHIEDIIKLASNSSGKKISISHNILIAVSYNKLYIFKEEKTSSSKHILNNLNCRFDFGKINFNVSCCENVSFDNNVEYFELDSGKAYVFRHRDKDDYIYPLGMKGRKKLSDYLSDKKIPLHKRDDVVLLCQDNEVIWVVGHGINERYKVKNDTKCIYKIAFKRADA